MQLKLKKCYFHKENFIFSQDLTLMLLPFNICEENLIQLSNLYVDKSINDEVELQLT